MMGDELVVPPGRYALEFGVKRSVVVGDSPRMTYELEGGKTTIHLRDIAATWTLRPLRDLGDNPRFVAPPVKRKADAERALDVAAGTVKITDVKHYVSSEALAHDLGIVEGDER